MRCQPILHEQRWEKLLSSYMSATNDINDTLQINFIMKAITVNLDQNPKKKQYRQPKYISIQGFSKAMFGAEYKDLPISKIS